MIPQSSYAKKKSQIDPTEDMKVFKIKVGPIFKNIFACDDMGGAGVAKRMGGVLLIQIIWLQKHRLLGT